MATCKKSAEGDQTAVVGPECRVRGVDRLRFVDASVMHSIVSENTNAPTIMVADLICGTPG